MDEAMFNDPKTGAQDPMEWFALESSASETEAQIGPPKLVCFDLAHKYLLQHSTSGWKPQNAHS